MHRRAALYLHKTVKTEAIKKLFEQIALTHKDSRLSDEQEKKLEWSRKRIILTKSHRVNKSRQGECFAGEGGGDRSGQ